MDRTGGEIVLSATAPQIDSRLAQLPADATGEYSLRFTQGEEFFLRLESDYEVPAMAVHHDAARDAPSDDYLRAVTAVLDQVAVPLGNVLAGLQFGFDPRNATAAHFYRVFEETQQRFLYLVSLDLAYRPLLHQVVAAGSNDVAPRYRTNRVFLTADLVPLDFEARTVPPLIAFPVEQSISQTWIGETGRGYVTQGIWIDRELNRFLTRLFVAPDQRIYPYYPFHARFNAICFSPIDPGAAGRAPALRLLRDARTILLPRIDDILTTLKSAPFSPQLPLFLEMRGAVDSGWDDVWRGLRLRAYLNEQNMKEYIVERR